ncbi:hypothetical protein [Methanomethylovorans sp.]|uniref:hypothetical protein n=1 Tax=Methanomethylovorans sp. TaxID=2758717 RepID=UPI00345EE560
MFNGLIERFMRTRDWKKSLLFSLISYCCILFLLIVVITFALKEFNFPIVSGVSAGYMCIVLMVLLGNYAVLRKRE